MPYEYYAENHDWDYTLMAAWNLVMAGQAASKDKKLEFSSFTGSMVLSFCAIESFMNSVAFSMPSNERYKDFDYKAYRKLNSFWDKLKKICNALDIAIDQSTGVFKVIEEMRIWRNSLVHFSPYSIETTEIQDTQDSRELHTEFRYKEYTKSVSTENAKTFYSRAYDFIDLVQKKSGLNPRAMCSYKVV